MGIDEARLHQYCAANQLEVNERLGLGNDGGVWRTHRTAVKVFWPERSSAFRTEVACYERLAELGVRQVLGFTIPRMLGADPTILAMEMEFVSKPSVLDFGKARLGSPPRDDFSEVEAHEIDMLDKWGSKLPIVRKVVRQLENYGIYYLDPQPGNINFVDDDADDDL